MPMNSGVATRGLRGAIAPPVKCLAAAPSIEEKSQNGHLPVQSGKVVKTIIFKAFGHLDWSKSK